MLHSEKILERVVIIIVVILFCLTINYSTYRAYRITLWAAKDYMSTPAILDYGVLFAPYSWGISIGSLLGGMLLFFYKGKNVCRWFIIYVGIFILASIMWAAFAAFSLYAFYLYARFPFIA